MIALEQAKKYGEKRKVKYSDEYYTDVVLSSRASAFTVSNLATLNDIDDIKKWLDAGQAGGVGFNDWIKAYKKGVINQPLSDARFELIYRNYTNNAYMAGKCKGFAKNKKRRPYLQYKTVNDTRTRDKHKRLHNFIAHIDDKIWEKIMPLNDHNCRCYVIAKTESQYLRIKSDGNTPELKDIKDDVDFIKENNWGYSVCSDELNGYRNAVNDLSIQDVDGKKRLLSAIDDFGSKDAKNRLNTEIDKADNNNKIFNALMPILTSAKESDRISLINTMIKAPYLEYTVIADIIKTNASNILLINVAINALMGV